MITPILQTERLILRPLSIQDADIIFDRWTSDDRVSKFVRWSTHRDHNDTLDWLSAEEKNLASNKVYLWGFELKDSSYLFGCGGLTYNEKEKAFELGYNIMHKYWNCGYTTEAARAILDFAVNELKETEFIAWHAVENPASGRVMEKCGFIYQRNEIHTKFDGITFYDTKMFRLKSEA